MHVEPTVYVVDDDEAVRNALRSLLDSVRLPVATYASAQEFLDAYDPARGGCLVVDLRMPGISGLELQERLVARGVTLPVIIITGHAEVATAVRAMKAGAVDFFEKPFSQQDLLDRIQHALARDARQRAEQAQRADVLQRLDRLTPREQAVLRRVVEGKANKVIAGELGISIKTVEAFRSKLMEKMEARSLAELVRLVLTAQWSPLAPPAAPEQPNQGDAAP